MRLGKVIETEDYIRFTKVPVSSPNGDIFANDLALLPFVVGREYFGYADLGWTFFPGDGVVVTAAVLHGL